MPGMVWRSQMQQALVSSQARSSPSRLAARADQSAQAFGPGLLALTSYAALSLLACGLHAWLNRAGASMHYHGVSRSWCVIFSVCYTHKVHTSAHASTHTDTRTHMHTHTCSTHARTRMVTKYNTQQTHTTITTTSIPALLLYCWTGEDAEAPMRPGGHGSSLCTAVHKLRDMAPSAEVG